MPVRLDFFGGDCNKRNVATNSLTKAGSELEIFSGSLISAGRECPAFAGVIGFISQVIRNGNPKQPPVTCPQAVAS